MSILTSVEDQIKDYKRLSSDQARWAWIVEVNKMQIDHCMEKTLNIILDNDQTWLCIGADGEWIEFDEPLGNMFGVVELLKAHRIECEFC